MPITTVRNILVAAGGVTALVDQRISPLIRAQDEVLPCITLTLVTTVPFNHLHGRPSLDENRVQVDSWAETYADARAVAYACREALESAGLVMSSETEDSEPDVNEYRVTQDWLLWT